MEGKGEGPVLHPYHYNHTLSTTRVVAALHLMKTGSDVSGRLLTLYFTPSQPRRSCLVEMQVIKSQVKVSSIVRDNSHFTLEEEVEKIKLNEPERQKVGKCHF